MRREGLLMVRESLIGGSRYGPHGENLGLASFACFSQQTERDSKRFQDRSESEMYPAGAGAPSRSITAAIRVQASTNWR